MKKQVMAWVIVLLLLNSLFAVAQTESSSSVDSSSCNWWCKVKAVFEGNVVGKGQTPPAQNEIGKPIVNPQGLKKGDVIKDDVDEYVVKSVSADGYIYLDDGDINPKNFGLFEVVSFSVPTPEPTPTPSPTPVTSTQIPQEILLQNPSKGSLTPAQKKELSTITSEEEKILAQEGYFEKGPGYVYRDNLGNIVITTSDKTVRVATNGVSQTKDTLTLNGEETTVWNTAADKSCNPSTASGCGKVFDTDGKDLHLIYTYNGDTLAAPGYVLKDEKGINFDVKLASQVDPDWSGDKEFSGLPGNSELSIEDGKLILDCGTICIDKPLEVDPSTGNIRAWTSDGWKDLTDQQVNAIPDVQAKGDLLAKKAKFSSEGKAYPGAAAKAYTDVTKIRMEVKDAEKELAKLEDAENQKKTLNDFENTLKQAVAADSSITDKESYIQSVMDAKKKDLQSDIDAQKAKVKQLDELHTKALGTASEDVLVAQKVDDLSAEAQTIDEQIKAKTELAKLKGLPTDEKKKLDDQISELKQKSKDKKEEVNKLKGELGQATIKEQGAAAPTTSCNSITNCQEKLQKKEITHGEAYDAMKVIADKDEVRAKQSDDSYKTLLNNIKGEGITLDKDGKIPNTASVDAVSNIGGTYLKIRPQTTTTKIAPEKISDFKTDDIVTIGDVEYKVGFVGQNRITFYPKDKDQTVVITYNDETEFQQGVKDRKINIVRTTGESKEDYLKRVNVVLEQQKSEHDKAQATATDSKQSAESIRWQGTWWDAVDNSPGYKAMKDVGSVLSGGFELVASLGSYRALSNLLFPDTTKEWMYWANDETLTQWADLPNFAAAEICGQDDAKRANQPGQSAAFITTTAGTFQAVGSIQAEKSPAKFPILCSKNKEDQWVCPKNLVCKDNSYCYKDKNAEKPEEGYFYKITWGVTAPSDEKFTPYVDEDGVAAKFNVYLDKTKPLYVKKGITEPKQVLQLTNGGHDGGMIVRYLPTNFNTVCIIFDKPIKDIGSDDIDEICSTIIPSTGGVVEYASSSKAETVTSTSADVELDI